MSADGDKTGSSWDFVLFDQLRPRDSCGFFAFASWREYGRGRFSELAGGAGPAKRSSGLRTADHGRSWFRHAAETVYRCSMTNAKQTSARAAASDCVITNGKEEQEKAQAPPVKERLGGFWNFRKKKGKASAENLKAAANDGNFQKASGSHLKETAASEKIIYSLQKELPSLESLVKARGAGVVIIYHTTGTESPLSIFPLKCFIIRAENKA